MFLGRLRIWLARLGFGGFIREIIGMMDRETYELDSEALLNLSGIDRRQFALFRQTAFRPECSGVDATNIVELGEKPIA